MLSKYDWLFLKNFCICFLIGALFLILSELVSSDEILFDELDLLNIDYGWLPSFSILIAAILTPKSNDPSDPDSFKKKQNRVIGTNASIKQVYREIFEPWTKLGYKISMTEDAVIIRSRLDHMKITSLTANAMQIQSHPKGVISLLPDRGRNFKNYEKLKSIIAGIKVKHS